MTSSKRPQSAPVLPVDELQAQLTARITTGEHLAIESDPEYWSLSHVDQEEELLREYENWSLSVADLLRVSFDDGVYSTEFSSLHARPEIFHETHDAVHEAVAKQVQILRRIDSALPLWRAAERVQREHAILAEHSSTTRWDETWHRLREWTNGQAQSERLAAQILLDEGFIDFDPSHPLGGPDGTKDALCKKDGVVYVMAVYFPRGQQGFPKVKEKILSDLVGVATNHAGALAFVTNQELRLAERKELEDSSAPVPIRLYHLERITAILDKPRMAGVRKQFLGINFDE